MSYSDPYNNPGDGRYPRHNYQDSTDYFNPYQTEQYAYQQPPMPAQHYPPPPPQEDYGLGRSNTAASRYTSASTARDMTFPPEANMNALPPLPANNSSRTLPGIPDEVEPEEFPSQKGPNVLRNQSKRASYMNANLVSNPNPNTMDRGLLRQSLTPLTLAPGK